MKKFFLLTSIAMLSFSLNSCGVMFGGSKYNGIITAKDHPNATIYVNGSKAGTGEVSGLYKRNVPLEVELEEEGCDSQTKTYHPAFRTGNFILSVVSWGLLGIAVDLGTGAAYKPDEKTYPEIQKVSDKKYNFLINYDKCTKE